MEEGREILQNTPLNEHSKKILENDRKVEEQFNFTRRLGITDPRERFFFYRYFELRARRAGGIGQSRLLSDPTTLRLRNIPIIGGLINSVQAREEKEEKELVEMKEILDKEVVQTYTTPEALTRIKDIEMAANDLAFKGVFRGEDQSQGATTVVDIEGIVEQWVEFWKNRLT